jgi:CheY-like chemotaxis protein
VNAALSPDPETGENLDHIRDSAEQATSLIRRLLSFARPADGARTSVEVNAQVRDIGRLLQPLIGEAISFELRLDPGVGFVEADASEIGQFLMNLAVNARDASQPGGTIAIRTRRVDLREPKPCYSGPLPAGSYVGIAVSDTGSGMDDEALERLFEPFFTSRGASGGTGLGLALVYAIVRRSGGDLVVESRPDHGTCIEAFLPRLDAPLLTRAEPLASRPEPGGGETVLVVEDQERVRAATARVIRSLGYRVLEAASAEAALEMELTLDAAIDLLLTDIVMPGMQGPELAGRLLSRRPRLRVLYLTGFADRAFGPNGSPDHPVLIKPVGQRVLASRLRAVLDAPPPVGAVPGSGKASRAARRGSHALP